jgi:hypothetical protein
MTALTDNDEPAAITPIGVDIAGERMLGAIELSCRSSAEFPSSVDLALRAALALGAEEPSLIRQLFGTSEDLAVLERQQHWREVFAAELRTTAQEGAVQASALPPLVEPFLIGGVGFHALRRVRHGEADRLGQLASDLFTFILTYYYPSPAEATAAAELSGR